MYRHSYTVAISGLPTGHNHIIKFDSRRIIPSHQAYLIALEDSVKDLDSGAKELLAGQYVFIAHVVFKL